MKIPLTDVVAHRHLLSPREAATLTLAVGREWDRKRPRLGDHPLPDMTHIELSDAGNVSFADSIDTDASGGTLSGLLGQLLGLDEPHAPRQPVPGGLLITIAGRLGPMQLPSSQEDGFRRALLRFADEDPGVLAKVFTRIVTERVAAEAEEAHGRSAKVRRGPERRRQPPAVAALRRAVRDLERQTFEAKASARANRLGAGRGVRTRRRLTEVLVAGAVALLLSATGFLIGATRRPTALPEERVNEVRTQMQPARPPADASIQAVAPIRQPAKLAAPAPTPRLVRMTGRKKADNHLPVTFAGGSRAITWSRNTR